MYYAPVVKTVQISRLAFKQLHKVPRHIVDKLLGWVRLVEQEGLEETRRIPGYQDEPLRGKHSSQRSVRLSRAYRAIDRVDDNGSLELVLVDEVSKHGY